RAVDDRLRRTVALKFLSRELAGDTQARARFLREARAASALDHANVGAIYDVGEDDGQPYLAIAFYEGQTPAQRIERGPLPIAEALAVLRQVAPGLSAAHAAGVVHRDIKPANVFITREGVVKVLDFGLAKQHEPRARGPGADAEALSSSGV